MHDDPVSIEHCITVSDDVLFHELDGEAVLLDLKTNIYFGFNRVGTRVWRLVQQHGSLQKVLDIMVEEYDGAPEVMAHDLLQWASLLQARGLLHVSPASPA